MGYTCIYIPKSCNLQLMDSLSLFRNEVPFGHQRLASSCFGPQSHWTRTQSGTYPFIEKLPL